MTTMISLRSYIVLLAVWSTYPLQTLSQFCNFCPDGSNVTNSDTLVPQTEYTCSVYAGYVNSLAEDSEECKGHLKEPMYSTFAGACGCPNVTNYDPCYNDCKDYVPDRVIPGSDGNITCKAVFDVAPWIIKNTTSCNAPEFIEQICGCGCGGDGDCGNCELCDGKYKPDNEVEGFFTCENLSNYVKGGADNETCYSEPNSLYQCGCPVPKGSCSLCDGDIPDENKKLPDNFTCKQAMYFAGSEKNQTKCDSWRSVIGSACDCSTAPLAACTITCPAGKKFDMFKDYSEEDQCGKALFDTNAELGANCDKQSFLEKCCVDISAAPTDVPTDAPTDAPTSTLPPCVDIEGSWENARGVEVDCAWVISQDLCAEFGAAWCPVSCDMCPEACEDVASFEDIDGTLRDCAWVISNDKCSRFQDRCVKSCGIC